MRDHRQRQEGQLQEEPIQPRTWRAGSGARITLEEDSGAVTVRVEDDGPGIPEDALEAVFEPFWRLDTSRGRGTGGTGLGLAIARQVVRGHGGTIYLSNRPQSGLMATVRLPRTVAGSRGDRK